MRSPTNHTIELTFSFSVSHTHTNIEYGTHNETAIYHEMINQIERTSEKKTRITIHENTFWKSTQSSHIRYETKSSKNIPARQLAIQSSETNSQY